MRHLWFYELFDAVLFLLLMCLGEIATWVFLDWKGRALSKRGVVYGASVSRTESVDGKQREGFSVLSCRDEPSLEMFTFLYVTLVLVWKFGGMERGRGRSEHVPRVVCETLKQWKLLPVASKLCSLAPGWLDFWDRVMELKQCVHYLYGLLTAKWPYFAFQRPISYFLTLSNQNLCPWCNTGGEVSLQPLVLKNTAPRPLCSKHFWLLGIKEGA